jgi:hypothetical protein
VWDQGTDEDSGKLLAEARRHLIVYILCFGALFAAVASVFWWSRTAVDFGAARVTGTNTATYRVFGVVRDAGSGRPVPWAKIQDDPEGMPPLFDADGGADGTYALATVPLEHQVVVSARGYRPRAFQIGRPWFQWWPKGEQRLDVELTPEP